MSPTKVVLLNLILALLVIVFFFRKRKPVAPSKLNLKKNSSDFRPDSQGFKGIIDESPVTHNFDDATFTGTFAGKDVNVVFNFNGHSFDAYEILGLPAGSSFLSVQTAYERAIKNGIGGDSELIQAAFDAIKAKHS